MWMKCDCGDIADLKINDVNYICLPCFYYKVRMDEISDKVVITIIPKNHTVNKFLNEEVM